MSLIDESADQASTAKEAQVACAGVTYYVRKPVLGSVGEQLKGAQGEDLFVTVAETAVMGDVVELSEFEYERLFALNAIQEPGSAPLPGQPGRPIRPTPFGVPLPDPDSDEENPPLTAFKGPVMGDPTPIGAENPNDPRRIHGAPLSAEDAARLEEAALQAAGQSSSDDADGDDSAALREGYEQEERETLESEANDLGLTVVRSDGRDDLPPRKIDYVDALVAHHQSDVTGSEEGAA